MSVRSAVNRAKVMAHGSSGTTLKTKVYENNFDKSRNNHQTIIESSHPQTFTDFTSQARKTGMTTTGNKPHNTQQSPSIPQSTSDKFKTMNSVYYNKDQLYRVSGNQFVNKSKKNSHQKQNITAFDHQESSGIVNGEGVIMNTEGQTIDQSMTHQRSVVFTASPNKKRQDISDYTKIPLGGGAGAAATKTYFNVQSSQMNSVYHDTSSSFYNNSNKSRNNTFQMNKSADNNYARKRPYQAQQEAPNQTFQTPQKPNPANSLLLNILNLKQFQATPAPHHVNQHSNIDGHIIHEKLSPEKSKIINQIQGHKITNTIGKFFQKRKIIPDFNAKQENKKIVADIKNSRNQMISYIQGNLTEGQVLNINGDSKAILNEMKNTAQFYRYVKRKDFQEEKQQELFQQLGIDNQYYKPGEKNQSFLENHLNKSINENTKSKSIIVNSKHELSVSEPQSIQKKKPNPYQKREKEFQGIYEKKLKELRKNNNGLNHLNKTPEYMSIKKVFNQPDISLYKERNDPYKIVSNRIKTRALISERRYIDKNVRILERFFDPLRIRLRVMPISRAPLVQGKNSDYYFVEACKLSLKGDLTNAIEQLKKGLELKPTHFLCRFNHGVLMFKFGLILEATQDFEMINQLIGLKEPAAAYNLAVCYVQNGKYQEAFQLCVQVIETILEAKIDKELLSDTYKLKGICAYRLGDPIESIKCYNFGNKYKQDMEEEQKQQKGLKIQPNGQELECIYINLFIEETRHIFQDRDFQRSILRVSKSYTNLKPLIFDLQNFKRFGSEKNLQVKGQKDKRHQQPQYQDQIKFQNFKDQQNIQQQLQQPQYPSDQISLNLEQSRPFAKSLKKADRQHLLGASYDRNAYLNPASASISPKRSKKNSQHYSESVANNKSFGKKTLHSGGVSHTEIAQLKSFVGITPGMRDKDDETASQKQRRYEEQFYKEFKEASSGLINAGSKYRYEKLYGAQSNQDLTQLESDDLTKEESEEIAKRRRIENELLDPQSALKLHSLQIDDQQEDKFLKFLINNNEIKTRQLAGTQNDNSFSQVLQEQRDLEFFLTDLRTKFIQKELEWERDFEKEQKRLNYSMSSNDDNNNKHFVRQVSLKQKKNRETVIDKLNKSLLDNDITPDDIQNILIRDREEKQIKESQNKFQSHKARKRLALRQVEVIRKEFSMLTINEQRHKSLRQLDKILSPLKFFSRFDEETRKKIYLNAELISMEGQTVIFNQGDVGDKLFIILKGRVAVQINSPEYGNLPVVVATLNDGEQFGELSLIKLNKLQDNSKQGEISNLEVKEIQEFARRKATCITVEQTDLLALPKEFSVTLYQPESAKKKVKTQKSPGKSERNSNMDCVSQEQQDELNQKIQFLQSISLFEEIDAQLLMPIAVNLVPYTYNFGEYILKEGEVPRGLYIVKSGQCKVASQRIADRNKKDLEQQQLNKKLGEKKRIKDKHPLFNEFDADNSILNEVKSFDKAFQNDRIYVTNSGDQVKGKVVYQDIMVFSQLMPKNFFGGRSLLPFEMYMNLRRIFYGQEELQRDYPKNTQQSVMESESEEKFQLKSLLSVIADSGEVEVYILDKNEMSFIPDFILRKVYEKIAILREPDRPFAPNKIEEIKDAMIRWDKYKVKCVEKLFKEKQLLEKNSKIR